MLEKESIKLRWITDRTIDDVAFISQPTVDRGLLKHDKGALNYTDLNRIYDNIKILYSNLKKQGYFFTLGNTKTSWNMMDIPYYEDINDLRDIATKLKKELGFSNKLNEVRYWDSLDYIDMNLIESILKETERLSKETKVQSLFCGDVICGGEY